MLSKEDLKYKDEYCTEFVIKQIETVKKHFGIPNSKRVYALDRWCRREYFLCDNKIFVIRFRFEGDKYPYIPIDPELKNTIAVKDIVISKYDLIKQFNLEFKHIYEDNKYYLSKEYEQECKEKQLGSVCQEYVLKTFIEYIPIFDKYLEKGEEL